MSPTRISVIILGAAVAGGVGGAISARLFPGHDPPRAGSPRLPDTLEAREFILLDDTDRPVGRWGTEWTEGLGLRLLEVELSLRPDGYAGSAALAAVTGFGPTLTLTAPSVEDGRAFMTAGPGGTTLEISGNQPAFAVLGDGTAVIWSAPCHPLGDAVNLPAQLPVSPILESAWATKPRSNGPGRPGIPGRAASA